MFYLVKSEKETVLKGTEIPVEFYNYFDEDIFITEDLYRSNFNMFNKCINIFNSHYGQLSQLFGMSLVKKRKELSVVLTFNDFLLDINVFTLRELDKVACKIYLLYHVSENDKVKELLKVLEDERKIKIVSSMKKELSNRIVVYPVLCEEN